MLRLLQSIFGCSDKQQRYPETLIREAIERVVERTDPWLKAVSDYKNKLRPAVIRSLDHATGIVKSLPLTFGFFCLHSRNAEMFSQ
jgi:hypothetical protein